MSRYLVVVESPTKVKSVEKYLGSDYKCVATVGHFRDLPENSLGVDVENNFRLHYEYKPPVKIKDRSFPGGKERIDRIAKAAVGVEAIYLASDLDREGEAIAWHLQQSLKLGSNYKRITFDEITQTTLLAAIKNPRAIDFNLVKAQETRRAIDRLVGFLVSDVLSDAFGMKVTAGRVQSIAALLIVVREREISAFRPTNHFGVTAIFGEEKNQWSAVWDGGQYITKEQPYLLDENIAKQIAKCKTFKVLRSETKPRNSAPPAPFTTSVMLQVASSQLRFDADKTGRCAQALFEAGHINYIRTDSQKLGDDANTNIRNYLSAQGLPLCDQVRVFKNKEGTQGAHEAIRPIYIDVEIAGNTDDEKALYTLIRNRALASQMKDAIYDSTVLELISNVDGKEYKFIAKGAVLKYEGWKALYKNIDAQDDEESTEEKNENGNVPSFTINTDITSAETKTVSKTTTAPARYTEASLIKKLEAEGIGRPATYGSIVTSITKRGYVEIDKRKYKATDLGCKVIDGLLKAEFEFMKISFTRDVEEDLDKIADGNLDYLTVIRRVHESIARDLDRLRALGALAPRYKCPECEAAMRRNSGKRGFFWSCSKWQEGCTGIMDDKDGTPVPRTTHNCEFCDGELRKGIGKVKGYDYWYCTNRDECGKSVPDYKNAPMPLSLAQCECKNTLRRVKGSKGAFWSCNGYKDGCKNTFPDKGGKPIKVVKKSLVS